MSLSQMQVFNKYFMPATIETLAQMVDKFNAASGGAIRLTTEGFEGDFLQESFYAAIHSARRRVDRYANQTSATATDLTQLKHSTVKVAGGFGPVRYEPSQMSWLNKPTAEGVEVASRNFAEALMQDQLNTAIAALVAAIGNQGVATVVDVSATKKADYATVNDSHALFGDHSTLITAQVMDGVSYHGFIGQNLANSATLFQAGNVRVVDILGRAVVVTDAPALYTAAVTSPSTPAKRRILSLVANAATVHDSRDIISNIETSIRVTHSVVEGLINQPRFSRQGDYNGAGLILEGLLERLGNDASHLIDIIRERALISGDAVFVAEERNARAKALIDFAVWCDDGAANIAALAASLAASRH